MLRDTATHRTVVMRVLEGMRDGSGRVGDATAELGRFSLLPVVNAFWDLPMAPGGIYQAAWPEILHWGPQGIARDFKHHMFDIIERIYEGVSHGLTDAIIEIEKNMRDLPQFTDGIHTLPHFSNGVWALHWISAEDHIAMLQQLVFAIGYPTTTDGEPEYNCRSEVHQKQIVVALGLLVEILYVLHRPVPPRTVPVCVVEHAQAMCALTHVRAMSINGHGQCTVNHECK